jgi:hypothetical protein
VDTLNTKTALVGWRGWTFAHPHFLTNGKVIWVPGERLEAICTARWHEDHERIPVQGCSCGIYAFTTPNQVKEQGYTNQDLLGEVYLWGRVIEHERGFKAEYAYPKNIFAKAFELWRPSANAVLRNGPEKKLYDRYLLQSEYVAVRYNVPFQVINTDHPIFTVDAAERQRQAEEERKQRLSIAESRMKERKKNAAMRAAAEQLPPTVAGMGYKNLWEQIEAEAEELVASRLRPRKKI